MDAPIIVNAEKGEAYIEPIYYFVGHFSKFVIAGSIRIEATVMDNASLDVISFLRPDNIVIVIFYNPFNSESSETVVIHTSDRNRKIPLDSVHTVLCKL